MQKPNYKRYDNNHAALIGAVTGLARAAEGNRNRPDNGAHQALLNAMRLAVDIKADDRALSSAITVLHAAKARLVPRCATCSKACGRNDDFDWNEMAKLLSPEILELKHNVLANLLALEAPLSAYCDSILFNGSMEFLYRGFFEWGRSNVLEALTQLLRETEELRQKFQYE